MSERMTSAEARALLAKTAGQQPESLVLGQVRDYLRAFGWFVVRIQQGPLCHRGMSDLICIKEGRVVFVECKTAKGKLSTYQRDFRDAVGAAGGTYVVARSLEDVIDMGRTP